MLGRVQGQYFECPGCDKSRFIRWSYVLHASVIIFSDSISFNFVNFDE